MAKKTSKKNVIELPGVEGPGVSPVSIPAIDALAEDYIKERDKRTKLTPREIAAKGKLIEAIQAHKEKIGVAPDGTITYRYDTTLITLQPGKPKLKVKDETASDDDED